MSGAHDISDCQEVWSKRIESLKRHLHTTYRLIPEQSLASRGYTLIKLASLVSARLGHLGNPG
jgi:predicted transcriptional regulator